MAHPVEAQQGLETFTNAQFRELSRRFAAQWVVLPTSAKQPLPCPYLNWRSTVCRIE